MLVTGDRMGCSALTCNKTAWESMMPHPPVWMEQWEGQAVHDTIGMVMLMRGDVHPNREAVQAEVKVRADSALDAHHTGDVFLAIVAVVQPSAEHGQVLLLR